MVYMFIARITMAESSDVKTGFFICLRSGKLPKNGVNCNPFDLKRTPNSTCVTLWSIGLNLDLFLHNKLANKLRDFRECEMT